VAATSATRYETLAIFTAQPIGCNKECAVEGDSIVAGEFIQLRFRDEPCTVSR